MPKKSDNSYVLPLTVNDGGVHGGGWTTSIRIADDGWMVCRNDTQTGNIRGPSDTKWTQLHRYGDNVPLSYYSTSISSAYWIYDTDICKSNSNVIWMAAYGILLKSTNRGTSYTKVTAFKSGTPDDTLTFVPHPGYVTRIGGNQLRIDPVNPNYVALGHPVDGGYVTTDGGTTMAIPASLPAPINATGERRGVHWAFDRSTSNGTACQTVYCMIAGRGIYRSTTGLGGSWSFVTGGPLYATSMEAAGGKLYVCGDGTNTNTQLYVLSGSTWTQPSGVSGMALAVNPSTSAQVICMNIGGGMFYSANSGTSWANYDNIPGAVAAGGECPWLAVTGLGYVSTGAIAWDNRTGVNRLWVACGIGTFYFDNPPRTDSTPFVERSRGIKQMLLKNAAVTSKGVLFVCGEDRPLWRFERGQWGTEATGHGPNYNYAIRHGGDIDFAPEDENYVVGVYIENNGQGPRYAVSTDNGKNWIEPANEFTVVRNDAQSVKAGGGNIAVTGSGKFTWIPTNGGGIRYTLNGGSTWNTPVFKDASNNVLNMTNIVWHWAYYMRKKALVSDKATAGKAYIYTPGVTLSSGGSFDYTTQATLGGLYVTTDHGANWTRIRAQIESGDHGMYSWKLRLVPGNATHMFSIPCNGGGTEGPYVSTDSGVTFTQLTAFQSAQDVCFSPRPSNRTYPRVTVWGKMNVAGTWTDGIWYSDDFNYASPTTATWTLLSYPPDGIPTGDGTLVGDMSSYPGIAIIPNHGGFAIYEDPVRIAAA